MASTSSSGKRAWKLQEFVAHSSNVNCLALGHKSGRVMVTGGEDKKVNMWAVGKPNCIMSLSGHTSPVEAVRFGNAEEIVVAGSLSGALKIWDLEAAKIVRTLTGHKSNIRCLDFHPYGDFVASGSLDTNIKLWDIRRKGCIFTYKGHTNCVNSIRFSPDGRWIASAGEDGMMKLWDLTAGKLLNDFRHHTGPVNTVEFHPNEFLLASGSSDRTVKFWDLESFQLVSSTDGESTGIRCIFFHPDGMCMYAGAQDMLKVYGWEPAQCFDSMSMNWGKVVDIATANNQLIGATFSQTNVSTFVVNIQKVQPLGGPPLLPSPSPPKSASGRRSFVVDRPLTQSTHQQPPPQNRNKGSVPKEEPDDQSDPSDLDDDAASVAEIKDPGNYQEVFHPRYRLAHSPTRQDEPFQEPPDEGPMPAPVMAPTSVLSSRPVTNARQSTPPSADKPPKPFSQAPPTAKPASQAPPSTKPASQAPPTTKPASQAPPTKAPTPVPTKEKNSPTKSNTPQVIPANRHKPVGLNVEDFLPKQQVLALADQETPSDMSESEAISSIIKGHDYMVKVMNSRHRNLQIVRALWTGGNIKTALDSALGMNDLPVIVDLFNVLLQKPGLWNLDLCNLSLPQLAELMSSKYENYVTTGCAVIKLVIRNFASLIKSNVAAPPSVGVDITREERYHKCMSCYKSLMNIRSTLEQKQHLQGHLGSQLRELQMLMAQFD